MVKLWVFVPVGDVVVKLLKIRGGKGKRNEVKWNDIHHRVFRKEGKGVSSRKRD